MDVVGEERKEVSFGVRLVGCYCVLMELLNHMICFPSLTCIVIKKIKKNNWIFFSHTRHLIPYTSLGSFQARPGSIFNSNLCLRSGRRDKIVDTTGSLETVR